MQQEASSSSCPRRRPSASRTSSTLMFHFDGIADMKRLPGALYVVDPRKEAHRGDRGEPSEDPVVRDHDSNWDTDLTPTSSRQRRRDPRREAAHREIADAARTDARGAGSRRDPPRVEEREFLETPRYEEIGSTSRTRRTTCRQSRKRSSSHG